MIIVLRLANYRLCRCNVLIKLLLLSKHRLCRCNVLIVILMAVKCRLCRRSVLVEMLLFASYRLCRCRFVIGMLLLVIVIGILLLESFTLPRCNALTSVCYYYSSLKFEVLEVWCTDSTGTSG